MVTHTSNPCFRRQEAEGSPVSGQSGLHSEFKTSLGYIARPIKRKKKTEREREREIERAREKKRKRKNKKATWFAKVKH
jgi:hypothetical protein